MTINVSHTNMEVTKKKDGSRGNWGRALVSGEITVVRLSLSAWWILGMLVTVSRRFVDT